MAMKEKKPHFVMLPLMAYGHMIPALDISRLLAKRGVTVTVLMTPHNFSRHETVINRAKDSGLDIHIVNIHLPYAEVGLPEGYENFDSASFSVDNTLKFFSATGMLKDQVQELLQELKPFPSCLISDAWYTWSTKVATELGVPRILFHGNSCFYLSCMHMLTDCKEVEEMASDSEYFAVPGLPDRIEMTMAQLRGFKVIDYLEKSLNEMVEAEVKAFGVVVNTFEDLEPAYIKTYREVKGKNVWCIGPVSWCNEDELDKVERGNKPTLDEHDCLKWLDSHEPSSVIYVCLGTLSNISTSQLIELGLGLEGSSQSFVWVIRHVPDEFKTWLSEEKFEEKIKGRGLLIRGWAPQVVILSHPAVGGFLTHCGWNSTLEGITAGLPMITWPLFADQFCNEKLVVNVTKTGVPIGVEAPVTYGEEELDGVVVNDIIKNTVERLMDGGEEGKERRNQARRLGEMAKRAVEEGGSSFLNMTLLIQDIVIQKDNSGDGHSNSAASDKGRCCAALVQ